MFQSYAKLRENSERGPIIFWTKIVITLLAFAMFGANIYGIVINADSDWIKIIGVDLCIIHGFSMVFALISGLIAILGLIGVCFCKPVIMFTFFVGSTVACIILNFIILSYQTEAGYLTDYTKLSEYCTIHVKDDFCLSHNTEWALKMFARARTIDSYDAVALILVPLTIILIVLVFFIIIQPNAFEEEVKKQPEDKEALNPQQNENLAEINDPEVPQSNDNQDNQPAATADDNNDNKEPKDIEEANKDTTNTKPEPKPNENQNEYQYYSDDEVEAEKPKPKPKPKPMDEYYYEEEDYEYYSDDKDILPPRKNRGKDKADKYQKYSYYSDDDVVGNKQNKPGSKSSKSKGDDYDYYDDFEEN